MEIKTSITEKQALFILENLSDGLMLLNEENKLMFINKTARDIFKIKEDDTQILEKPIQELSSFPLLINIFYLLGKRPREIFRKELEISQDLILEVSSMFFEEGQKRSTCVTVRDVTKEKTIEKMKTEFVTICAHQLRTPLSSMQWAIERILQGREGKLSEKQKELLEKAFNDNKRMVFLVNDLLNLVKTEEGQQVYNFNSTNFDSIVRAVVKYYQEEIKRKEIRFELEILENLPEVRVDIEKIGFAVQSLLDNAIKYTPKGGKIKIIISPKDKEIEFQIIDTGIGIPKSQQHRVLGKFFRAFNAVKVEPGGSGTGLFIAKNIIESHKGRIWFDSEENKGTKFWFTLPI